MLRTGPRERVGWHKYITMTTEAEIDGRTLKAGLSRSRIKWATIYKNSISYLKWNKDNHVKSCSGYSTGVIKIRNKQYKFLTDCHQYFFGGKYDLIQLHSQIIHQNDVISMMNSWKPSAFSMKQWKWNRCTWNLFRFFNFLWAKTFFQIFLKSYLI